MNSLPRLVKQAAAWMLTILPLLGWWSYGLFDLDEGFYAAVTGEMLRRHEWITPYYNGQPWFEKPILLYWLSIPSVAVFGQWFGPRLPSILCTIALYWGLLVFGRRFLSERTGWLAMLFASTSLLMVGVGRQMMTDPAFNLCLSMALMCWYRSRFDGQKHLWFSAVWLGLSVLAKGPVGIVFFVLVVGISVWKMPTLRSSEGWLAFGAIAAAVICTWYVPAYAVSGQRFIQEFLIDQNVKRFIGGDAAHTLRTWYAYFLFIPVVLLGCFPWVFYAMRWKKVEFEPDEFQTLRFCTIWALSIFVFFSLSGAKLPHYILPVIPPICLIAGAVVHSRKPVFSSFGLGIAAASTLLCLLFNWGFNLYYYGGEVFGRVVPSAQADLHRICLQLKATHDEVYGYQLSRRTSELGTGKLKVQETSQPSMVFYLDRTVPMIEDPSEIPPNTTGFVVTRPGRFKKDFFLASGFDFSLNDGIEASYDYFVVFDFIPDLQSPGMSKSNLNSR